MGSISGPGKNVVVDNIRRNAITCYYHLTLLLNEYDDKQLDYAGVTNTHKACILIHFSRILKTK